MTDKPLDLTAPGFSKPRRLAAAALTAAIDGKWQYARDLLQRLGAECPDGLTTALIGCCDTLHAHATDGDLSPIKIRLAHMAVETGAIDNDVPERIKWAGRLITARLAMDEDQFKAVCDEITGQDVGTYVGAVFETVALSIRSLPRGYARMGGAS